MIHYVLKKLRFHNFHNFHNFQRKFRQISLTNISLLKSMIYLLKQFNYYKINEITKFH